MSSASSTILGVTTVLMFGGGLAILVTGRRRTAAESLHTLLHGIVPIIAGCLYFAMATGQGLVVLPTDAAAAGGAPETRVFYFARYIDWTVTTPLLLVALCAGALQSGKSRHDLIAGAVLADVIMIGTAFAFGASTVGWIKWAWFAVSCAAFLGVYYVLWVSLLQANASEPEPVRATYRREATLLSVLWLAYPFILAVSPDGLGAVGEASSVAVIAVLDVLAKVAYGWMSVASDRRANDRDIGRVSTGTFAARA